MTSVTIGSPEHHVEDPDLIGRRWRIGVLLIILADASFVAALVFSYFYLRGLNTENAWLLPGQQTASIGFQWIIAGVMVASAVMFTSGRRGIQAGHEARFVTSTIVGVALLVLAAVLQAYQLATFPFGVASSAYSSALYTMAGANLLHLGLTVFLGVGMWNRGRLHIYNVLSNWQVQLVGLWWTWVATSAVLVALVTSFISSPGS